MRRWFVTAVAPLALIFTAPIFTASDAAAQWWTVNRPLSQCSQIYVPPGKIAHLRRHAWTKQGIPALLGQWNHECNQESPGAAVLATYQHNWGWVTVECYSARNGPVCYGAKPNMGIR